MKRIVLVVAPMVAILAVVGLGLGFLVIRRGPVGPGPRRWFDRRRGIAVAICILITPY